MSIFQLKPYCLLLCIIIVATSCNEDETSLEFENSVASSENYSSGSDGPNRSGGRQRSRLENDVVVYWMDLFLELDRHARGMRPNASARAIAYINLAAYEAVVDGLPDYLSNSERIPGFTLEDNENRPRVDWLLALNSSYATAMNHFLINLPVELKAGIDELEESLESDLSDNLSDRTISDSRAWGSSIAQQVISYSQTDTEAEKQILDPQPTSYVPPVADGNWTFSAEPERALFPYWEDVRTFLASPSQTTSRSPLGYSEDSNSEYYQQMLEVYTLNNEARDNDGAALWIAEFWSDDVEGLMFSPPARQLSIASQLIEQSDLPLGQALYLNLKLGFALNDAAVCTWKYKYQHMVMRPSVFIQQFVDPAYQTNLYRLIPWPNPTFPSYPSGHSCFASASAGVFIDFFGNQTEFVDRSHEGRSEFRGGPRLFNSFEQMAEENGNSRIPLGVHLRMDCTEGLRLGYEISESINRYNLKKERA